MAGGFNRRFGKGTNQYSVKAKDFQDEDREIQRVSFAADSLGSAPKTVSSKQNMAPSNAIEQDLAELDNAIDNDASSEDVDKIKTRIRANGYPDSYTSALIDSAESPNDDLEELRDSALGVQEIDEQEMTRILSRGSSDMGQIMQARIASLTMMANSRPGGIRTHSSELEQTRSRMNATVMGSFRL